MKNHFQQILLERVKEKLDSRHTLVDEITDLLDISKDSAYRRMRGETLLSLDESVKLARHFRISLSEVAGHADTATVFNRQPVIKDLEGYRSYMKRSLEQLEYIQGHKDHLMYYSAKDLPVFYQFAFPELAAFKIYVWLKSVFGIGKINESNYDISMIPEDLIDLAQRQWEVFSRINTIEIWNDTTVLSLIKQIEYYYEAGMFNNKEEALKICDQFHLMMKLIYKQSLNGQKVHSTNMESFSSATYKMYYHEILLMDNHILAELDDVRAHYFIPYAGLNFLSTGDPALVADVQEYIQAQTDKSSLISDVSEKDRNKFFIRIKNQIESLKERISLTDPFM